MDGDTMNTVADRSNLTDRIWLKSYPEGVPAEQVTLLQHNDDADLTLSVVQTGKTDKAADKLFADLKKEIESDQSVKDAQVDAATADSVAYRYTQANENTTTRESCIAHLSADK